MNRSRTGKATAPADDPVQIFADFARRRMSGESIDFEQFCREHTRAEQHLRWLYAHWRHVEVAARHAVQERKRQPGGGTVAIPLADQLKERLGDVDPGVSLDAGSADLFAGQEKPAEIPLLGQLAERGKTYKRYSILREIARGGMGRILRVWDRDLRRKLAMKVMLGQTELPGSSEQYQRYVSRMLEEAQITSQLDHPAIVPIYEVGVDDSDRVYFTMRLVKGRNLASVFRCVTSGKDGWSVNRVLHVLLKVCDALAYAHSRDVVHRDLKPDNIMVGRFGEVYVMDWGLARVMGKGETAQPSQTTTVVSTDRARERQERPESPLLTMSGDKIGTPAYMAPEQAAGLVEELGQQSDVYSVGAMLYQLITGAAPFTHAPYTTRTPLQILEAVRVGTPEPVGKLAPLAPPQLVEICEKAMQRQPMARYSSMEEMAAALRNYIEDRMETANADTSDLGEAVEKLKRRGVRIPAAGSSATGSGSRWMLIAAVVFFVAGAVVWAMALL